MHRAYLSNADFSQQILHIEDAHERHHLERVLRLQVGDMFSVFNHRGSLAQVRIVNFTPHHVEVKIESVVEPQQNPGPRFILAMAMSKRFPFEDLIEKLTELGVDEIIPLHADRSHVMIPPDRASLKAARFEKVAIAAAKQCGRVHLPRVHGALTVQQALNLLPDHTAIIIASLHGNPLSLREALGGVKTNQTIAIFIGPEGDFTSQEVAAVIAKGGQAVHLGKTVLRVETAVLAAASYVRLALRDA